MCGRCVTLDEAAMERAYNLTAPQWQAWMDEAYRQSYNVAPSQRVPVFRVIRHVGGLRRIDPMRWGLIPFFARGERRGRRERDAGAEFPSAPAARLR
jgi:putative SOS response-associated peptidase YedK